MSFTLEKVVPWGRSYDEYVHMFKLSKSDLSLRLLGCGDGPAAFNSVLSERGGSVVSIDPIYEFSTHQIRDRISTTYPTVMAQMQENCRDYVWSLIPSLAHLGEIRLSAMEAFLADYDEGRRQGRYVPGELPSLPFTEKQFDIALSSHFLFLYSAHLSMSFHLQALTEMLRVAHEVRVFPLLALDGSKSVHLNGTCAHFQQLGFDVMVERVPYEFQRGGNQMLVIKQQAAPSGAGPTFVDN